MIRFSCPQCKLVLQATEQKVGTVIACPKCSKRMKVPDGPTKAKVEEARSTQHSFSIDQAVAGGDWFYVKDKKKVGPVTLDDLKRLLTANQLQPTDLIIKTGMQKWLPIHGVLDLIPQKPPAAATPAPASTPAAGPKEWFYVRNKVRSGPVSMQELKQLAGSGQLAPTDMVLKEGTQRWLAAKSLGELFPGGAPAPAAPSPVAAPPPAASAPEKKAPAPAEPSKEWFYVRNKQKSGPLPLAELRAMVSDGRLAPSDMVLRPGSQKYSAAEDVEELFGPAPVPPEVAKEATDRGPAVPERPKPAPLPATTPPSAPAAPTGSPAPARPVSAPPAPTPAPTPAPARAPAPTMSAGPAPSPPPVRPVPPSSPAVSRPAPSPPAAPLAPVAPRATPPSSPAVPRPMPASSPAVPRPAPAKSPAAPPPAPVSSPAGRPLPPPIPPAPLKGKSPLAPPPYPGQPLPESEEELEETPNPADAAALTPQDDSEIDVEPVGKGKPQAAKKRRPRRAKRSNRVLRTAIAAWLGIVVFRTVADAVRASGFVQFDPQLSLWLWPIEWTAGLAIAWMSFRRRIRLGVVVGLLGPLVVMASMVAFSSMGMSKAEGLEYLSWVMAPYGLIALVLGFLVMQASRRGRKTKAGKPARKTKKRRRGSSMRVQVGKKARRPSDEESDSSIWQSPVSQPSESE